MHENRIQATAHRVLLAQGVAQRDYPIKKRIQQLTRELPSVLGLPVLFHPTLQSLNVGDALARVPGHTRARKHLLVQNVLDVPESRSSSSSIPSRRPKGEGIPGDGPHGGCSDLPFLQKHFVQF